MGRRTNYWEHDDEIHKWAKENGRKGYTGNRSRDTQVSADDRKAYYKAQMQDYDTRKAMETFNLAVENEDFMKELGGKNRKIVKNYMDNRNKNAKGGEKDGMIVGLSNFKEYDTIKQFERAYHKHTLNNGGAFDGTNDRGGNTMDMMKRMRKFHDRNFATKDDLDKLKNDEVATDEPTDDAEAPYTPSANLQRDLDLVSANENGLEFSSVFHDPEDSEDLRDKQAQQFKDQYQNSLGNNVFVANTDYIGGN